MTGFLSGTRTLQTGASAMQLSRRILLLFLAHRLGKKRLAKFIHTRYRKDFFKTLSIEERRRRYRKIPRCALIPLKLSPWQKLLHSQNDQAFITMMGLEAGHTPFDPSGMIVEFEYTHGQKREV